MADISQIVRYETSGIERNGWRSCQVSRHEAEGTVCSYWTQSGLCRQLIFGQGEPGLGGEETRLACVTRYREVTVVSRTIPLEANVYPLTGRARVDSDLEKRGVLSSQLAYRNAGIPPKPELTLRDACLQDSHARYRTGYNAIETNRWMVRWSENVIRTREKTYSLSIIRVQAPERALQSLRCQVHSRRCINQHLGRGLQN